MESQLDLSIIIVSWNVKDLLNKCIKSIYTQTKKISFEVFVIDNKSTDGTVEMLTKEFVDKNDIYSNLNIVFNNHNAGFAKANNQGITQATGRFILLLNPDTELIEPGTLEKCIKFMKENQKCGVLGCKLLNSDKSLQPSTRRFPTFLSQALIMLKFYNLWPSLPPVKRYYALDFNPKQTSSVDQVMGAFLLTRKSIIDQIGMLDEKFWIWFEEVDFCKRVKKLKYLNIYFPEAKIIHHHGQSFKKVLSYKKQKQLNKSILYYFKKYHSFFAYLGLLLLAPVSLFLALVVQTLEKIRVPVRKYKKVQ